MAAPEPTSKPEFAAAVRGYDRTQVDDYLDRVHDWLAKAEARRASAEEARTVAARELAESRARLAMIEERSGVVTPESMATFGQRLGQVLQSAVGAADELQVTVRNEAEEQRQVTVAECKAMLARAQEDAERLLDGARRKEREISDQIAELDDKRAAALGDLARLQQHLADILAAPSPPSASADVTGDDVVPETIDPEATGREAVADTPAPTLVQPVPGSRHSGGAGLHGMPHSSGP